MDIKSGSHSIARPSPKLVWEKGGVLIQPPPSSEAGFTLFEILVGLAISSLVMVGLSLAMKTVNQGFDQATASIGRQATIATGLYIVAGDISRIERVIDDPDQPTQFLFFGSGSEAIYVLAERPGNNRAGLYWVRLLVRSAGKAGELVRQRAPYAEGQHDLTALEWSDEVVLMRGELAIALSYRAPRLGLREWASGWQARNMLPGQIKIEVTDTGTGRLRVPVFVQTLKISAEAGCAEPAGAGCSMAANGQLNAGTENQ